MLTGCPINKLEINYKRVKQDGSRSGPKLIRSQSGSNSYKAISSTLQKYLRAYEQLPHEYALKYFYNVELMALYAYLAGNDVTSFNVTPI